MAQEIRRPGGVQSRSWFVQRDVLLHGLQEPRFCGGLELRRRLEMVRRIRSTWASTLVKSPYVTRGASWKSLPAAFVRNAVS
jgi:hypothetical protein